MKLTRIVPVVAALSLLAACSPTPGTAASVDGAVLTESRVSEIVEGCETAAGENAGTLPRATVVQQFIFAQLYDRLAGTGINEAQLEAVARDNGMSTLLDDDDCRALVIDNIKTSLLQQQDINGIVEGAQQIDVQLNPRYGAWNPTNTGFFQSPSLSVPAGR